MRGNKRATTRGERRILWLALAACVSLVFLAALCILLLRLCRPLGDAITHRLLETYDLSEKRNVGLTLLNIAATNHDLVRLYSEPNTKVELKENLLGYIARDRNHQFAEEFLAKVNYDTTQSPRIRFSAAALRKYYLDIGDIGFLQLIPDQDPQLSLRAAGSMWRRRRTIALPLILARLSPELCANVSGSSSAGLWQAALTFYVLEARKRDLRVQGKVDDRMSGMGYLRAGQDRETAGDFFGALVHYSLGMDKTARGSKQMAIHRQLQEKRDGLLTRLLSDDTRQLLWERTVAWCRDMGLLNYSRPADYEAFAKGALQRRDYFAAAVWACALGLCLPEDPDAALFHSECLKLLKKASGSAVSDVRQSMSMDTLPRRAESGPF